MNSSPLELVTISEESSFDVLRAYRKASTSTEKGLLYAKEISPRILRGENVFQGWPKGSGEITAANTLGTLPASIVSQRVLEMVGSKRPLLAGIVSDFSAEPASKGDVLTTRVISKPDVQAFNSTATPTSDVDIPVTLSHWVECRYSFTGAELAGTTRNLIEERAGVLAETMGNYIVDQVAALVTEANFGTSNQTIQASGWDFSTIASISRKMTTALVPSTGRFGWVNSTVAEALDNDSILAGRRAESPSECSAWGAVKGFKRIDEYEALPANSCNLIGYFGAKSSLVVAARPARNPSLMGVATPGAKFETVVDPLTGLSLVLNNYISSCATGACDTRLVALFGVAVGVAGHGHTLVSA